LVADRPRRRFVRDPSLRSVAVSAFLARSLEITYQLEPLSVAVAMNGVDSSAFRPGQPGGETVAHAVPVFGFVGRICVEKAPDTFLRACLLLAQERHDFAVQLVGDTNWGRTEPTAIRREVEELAAELRVQGIEVRQLGHVPRPDVPDALRDCDVHVVPSRWDEPCGLTILEGLATGVPIVASATGGSPELVGDAGLLFPRDDVESLARRLELLLDDPVLRGSLGALARDRARSFTWLRTWELLVEAAGAVGPRPNPPGQVRSSSPSHRPQGGPLHVG
jgi:glycosyltransferase involved in cell wall biosynthesis